MTAARVLQSEARHQHTTDEHLARVEGRARGRQVHLEYHGGLFARLVNHQERPNLDRTCLRTRQRGERQVAVLHCDDPSSSAEGVAKAYSSPGISMCLHSLEMYGTEHLRTDIGYRSTGLGRGWKAWHRGVCGRSRRRPVQDAVGLGDGFTRRRRGAADQGLARARGNNRSLA